MTNVAQESHRTGSLMPLMGLYLIPEQNTAETQLNPPAGGRAHSSGTGDGSISFRLDPIRDVQVLCPMNRGSLGVRELNTALQRALNPARPGQPAVEAPMGTSPPPTRLRSVASPPAPCDSGNVIPLGQSGTPSSQHSARRWERLRRCCWAGAKLL
jgi:hypothetical protein